MHMFVREREREDININIVFLWRRQKSQRTPILVDTSANPIGIDGQLLIGMLGSCCCTAPSKAHAHARTNTQRQQHTHTHTKVS